MQPATFSTFNRNATLNHLGSTQYDLVIIGGGITGAGIALDAATRGLKTALVEKRDFAFGTSSRSTKLVHGGLRYLKQLEFALVKEVGSERAVVHKLAPHLVVPEKMFLPLYEKRGMGYWLASIGLKIYDFLAGVKPEDQRKMLVRSQALKSEPLLKTDDVKGGALYAEYRTDDARLTIEIAKVAAAKGAVLINYAKAVDFIYEKEKISGVKVVDQLSKQSFDIRATVVINAGGPWVDELREINKSKKGKSLHLTKGVHIVVPFHRLPVRQAIYFDVADGRMIFAIPRGRVTYIGTTDTNYTGDKDDVFATKDDVRYLIDASNSTFATARLTPADVESTWAGLRPLIHEEGKSASELSRKDEIFISDTGLVSMAGGKLTGYRKMAERVVDLVIETHFKSRKFTDCATISILLAGAGLKNSREVQGYIYTVAAQVEKLGLKGVEADYLVHLYGRQADLILDHAINNRKSDPEITLAIAELWYGMNHEMVVRADDFLVRRTGLLYFNIHRFEKVKNSVLIEMAKAFGWDDQRLNSEKQELEKLLSGTLEFMK